VGLGDRALNAAWLRVVVRSTAAVVLLAMAAPWAVAQAASLQVKVQASDGKPLVGAVVFLESRRARESSRPLAKVEIAQKEKSFVPLVSVVTVGTAVSFPNLDTVRHHVYSFSPIRPFELKLYVGTPSEPVVFDRSGIAVLGCNIHDQMAAWVIVVETPWFGRSDANGVVSWPDLPEGSYRLRTWHVDMPVGAAALDEPLTLGAKASAVTVRVPGGRM
jgi:plastocyanin